MKLENERFLIIKKTKLFILSLDKIIPLFPNRDYTGKNRIMSDAFNLLENIYLANTGKECNSNDFKYIIMTKIYMLDFYLERAYKLHYISEEQCLKLSNSLLEINKMLLGWFSIKNGEDNKV